MSSPLSRLVRALMLALVLGLATARPAEAQEQGPSILRDTETEALFDEVAKPLVEAAKLDSKSVKVVLLNDSEINAFVAGSQNVYVNSGLITNADNVNQLQAVVAHELGHVAGGHAIRMGEGAKEATGISLATMVLGAIAIAAGAGDAGMGLMMMGQQAAMNRFRKRAPTSRAPTIFRRRASAARAASSSSRSFRTRSIASRSTRRTVTIGRTRFRASASQFSKTCTRRTLPGTASRTRHSRRSSSA
jgi:hypothetical protein